jgi:serine/threonine protein kinase
MLMDNPRHCTQCGAVLNEYALEGLCGNCLLKPGVEPMPEILDEPAEETCFADLRAGSNRSRNPEKVDRFGDYDVLDEIARGGMGIVYRARQVSLDRIVAVKMLLAGPMAGKDFIQRFRTEAAAAASLQHPNIVAIHEVGFAEGQHFFAMDYVEGLTLAQLVSKGPLQARKAAMYLKAIAGAIHFAHERNVLHRDLKPSNVLVDFATDQPRVTDFGLAKRLEAETELTRSGQLLGSPNYMSPEQATARRGTVGKRSDIYSLGAILYHLLTGRPPFQGETLTDVLHQLANNDPLAPHLLTPRVPHDLETICVKCLEKDPAKRYQGAQELVEELDRSSTTNRSRRVPSHAPNAYGVGVGAIRSSLAWEWRWFWPLSLASRASPGNYASYARIS